MRFLQEYYLEDFEDYANERFPMEYNALKACPRWVMEHKTIRNGTNQLQRVPMLLVGRPFFSHGIQNAWAWATGTSIHYYNAHRGEEIVSTLGDLLTNKVYYSAPLIWAAGHQDTLHGMTKSRRTTKALAELIINFMFLLEDKILSVPNPGNTDLLSDFEYACRMFVMRRDEDRNNPRDEYFPYYGNAYGQGGARGPGSWRSGGSSTSSTFSNIKDEWRDDDAPSSRLSCSPYRSSTTSAFKKPTSTKPSGTPKRSQPSVHTRKERNDERAASVSWSGSSYASTPSRASSTTYLGMFAPNATTIRSGSGTSANPIRLSLDRITVKPRVSTHSRSSSSLSQRPFSPSSRSSGLLNFRAPPAERGPDTSIKIKTEPDQARRAEEQPARKARRRPDRLSTWLNEQAHGIRVDDRILALERGLHKRRREVEELRLSEERSAQRIKVKQEAEDAEIEEIW